MRILVTGGAGFIGSALARALVRRGHRVTIMDCLSAQVHGEDPQQSYLFRSIPSDAAFVRGDVRVRADWLRALDTQDAVVHLAAETGTGQSMYEVERYASVNVGGTALMLDIFAKGDRSVRKVVVASSRAVYGEGRYRARQGLVYPGARSEANLARGRYECYTDDGEALALLPTDEGSTLHPTSVYGITKQTQESMVLTVCPSVGINAFALRYQNVYGPGQSLHNPYTGILSIFSTLMRRGEDVDIFEDGLESRDFVYIDDAVAATISAVESDGLPSQALNVGSGIATSVYTVADTLKAIYGGSSRVSISGHYRLGDIRHNYADLTRSRTSLGFAPKVSFAEGVAKFAAWVTSQPVADGLYSAAIDEMAKRGLLK